MRQSTQALRKKSWAGFLSTEDEELPGNLGLMDQTLALHWVHRNIARFGGDNTKITICGLSAGAASAHMHLFNPHAKGRVCSKRGRSVSEAVDAVYPNAFLFFFSHRIIFPCHSHVGFSAVPLGPEEGPQRGCNENRPNVQLQYWSSGRSWRQEKQTFSGVSSKSSSSEACLFLYGLPGMCVSVCACIDR